MEQTYDTNFIIEYKKYKYKNKINIRDISRITSIYISGYFIVTGHINGSIYLWDINMKCIKYLQKCTSGIYSIYITSDNTKIITSGDDCKINIYNIDLEFIEGLIYHRDDISSLYVTKNNKHLISGSSDGDIMIWDILNYKHIETIDIGIHEINLIYMTHDGKYIIYVYFDNTINIINIKNNTIKKLDYELNKIISIYITNNNKYLICGCVDNIIIIFDINTYICIKVIVICNIKDEIYNYTIIKNRIIITTLDKNICKIYYQK